MVVRNMLAEWTKLRSTASFWWTSALILVFTIGWTILFASLDSADAPSYDPMLVTSSYSTFSLAVVMIQAIMIVTTEYRFKVSGTNYQVTPQRWEVAVAKLLLYVIISVVLSFVTLVIAYVAGDLIAANPIDWTENEFVKRSLWVLPLCTAAVVVFCQGISWLIRQTAGAVSLVLVWWLILEGMLAMIPKVGDKIFKYAPFNNFNQFLNDTPNPDWGIWTSFGIFAAFAFGFWIIGVIVLELRDA
ncbi:ABC transporter permease [Corynebacterium breve]|uniref:ABC transporter permease n=1 Tax=Corynebacterium breve TaxID=3049799 RepID=A0ABY8VCK6_9CORY|nr:ABC transporter permease [Corynebacterium breve]WIM67406.1 ABC transporter permease [Corynebacterium breve]